MGSVLTGLDGHGAHGVRDHAVKRSEGAVLEPEGPVGDLLEARVVADHDDADPVVDGELAEESSDVSTMARVEICSGLIREDDRGFVGERACDGDALLLSAGQLIGTEAEAIREADLREEFSGAPLGRAALDAGEIARDLHVFDGGERSQEIEVLEHESEMMGAERGEVSLGRGGKVDAVDQDGATGGAQHRAEHEEQGGLAAAGGSHDQDDFAGLHVEVHVAHRVDGDAAFAVGLGQVTHGDSRHGHVMVSGMRWRDPLV